MAISTVYIGIDPGKHGGLAWLVTNEKGEDYKATGMPITEYVVFQWFKEVSTTSFPLCAVIERVSGFQGIEHPGSYMFEFGKSFGSLTMALTATQIPYIEVTPQRWQKELGISTRIKGETDIQFKGRLKKVAQSLFPKVRVTLETSDALLLCEYARRLRERKEVS